MHKTVKYLHTWYTNEWEVPMCFCEHIPKQFYNSYKEDFPLLFPKKRFWEKDDILVEDFILYTTEPCKQGMMAVKLKMSSYLEMRLAHLYPEALI